MADQPKQDKRTPGEEARAVMQQVLKKHTVCGELIITPETKAQFLKKHPGAQCAKDLAQKRPQDLLQSIHQAIDQEAEKSGKRRKSRNDNLHCGPSDVESTRSLYYRATDELLGFIPKEEWTSGQSRACDLLTTATRLIVDAPADVTLDQTYVCKPEASRSVSSVSSCKVTPRR